MSSGSQASPLCLCQGGFKEFGPVPNSQAGSLEISGEVKTRWDPANLDLRGTWPLKQCVHVACVHACVCMYWLSSRLATKMLWV